MKMNIAHNSSSAKAVYQQTDTDGAAIKFTIDQAIFQT